MGQPQSDTAQRKDQVGIAEKQPKSLGPVLAAPRDLSTIRRSQRLENKSNKFGVNVVVLHPAPRDRRNTSESIARRRSVDWAASISSDCHD